MTSPTRAGRRRDGWYCARGLPQVEVKLCSQIRGTDLKVLGFNIGAQVARQYHAGQVFLAGDSARIINPPTGRLGGKTPRSPGRPQPGLEAVAAVLHGQAGLASARYSIYTYHTM
jgi:putative polyketide hydroxylase